MGARKKLRAEAMKEERKSVAFAKLNNCPTSPRKMRLVADMIRGVEAMKAISMLQLSSKEASIRMEKLLYSAIDNWSKKNPDERPDDLYVKEVTVDGGRQLKRIRPSMQGRAHRIRKRSNHVTIVVD